MAGSFRFLEETARHCCAEIMERSGLNWSEMPEAEPQTWSGIVRLAHAWIQEATLRWAREARLDPTELLAVVVDQLRTDYGWDVAMLEPWLLYAAGGCHNCGLAMPLRSLAAHLRRCLSDRGDETQRTLLN